MSAQMDGRLVEMLRRRAEMAGDGPRFTVEDILGAGRVARRWRRRVRLAAAAMAVVAVLLAAGGVLAAVRRHDSAPVQPGPTTSAPDLVDGNVLVRADGLRTPVVLPTGWSFSGAVRIPQGWIAYAYRQLTSTGDTSNEYGGFLLPDTGGARRIGNLEYFRVSPTGTMVAGVDPTGSVVAYTLPGLVKIGQTTFSHDEYDAGPSVIGISRSGLVLVDSGLASAGAWPAMVWNPATGAEVTSTAPISTWGMTDDGRVLRSTVSGESYACIDLVTVGATIPSGATGLCKRHWYPQVSPGGRWLTILLNLDGQNVTVLLRASDVRAGRLRPVALDNTVSFVLFWDSATTFLTVVGQPNRSTTLVRCDVAGHCRAVTMPEGLTDPRPVPRFGP